MPPKGWSGPVVVDDLLYVGSMTGQVLAYDDAGADGNPYDEPWWSYPDETAISGALDICGVLCVRRVSGPQVTPSSVERM